MAGSAGAAGTPRAHRVRGVFADGRQGVEVREVELDAAPDGWVSVEVAYDGICGSDLHTIMGASPGGADVVLGHEIVGYVAEDTATHAKGTPVFVNPVQRCGVCPPCRSGVTTVCTGMQSLGSSRHGGMAQRVLAPASDLFAIPEGVDMRRAALVEPLANCVHAVRRSGLKVGDAVHVLGGGPIGIITALLARRAGASAVTLSEPAAARRRIAEDLGIATTDTPQGSRTAEVVFEASGHPSVAPCLTSWVAPAGTIVLVGMYPPGGHSTDLFDVALREITLVGSLTYGRVDIEAALPLLADLPLERLVSEVVPLEGVAGAVESLRAGTAMKILVQP